MVAGWGVFPRATIDDQEEEAEEGCPCCSSPPPSLANRAGPVSPAPIAAAPAATTGVVLLPGSCATSDCVAPTA